MTKETPRFDIETLDLDAKVRIEAISKDILGLGKKDTEATFKLGALLEEASELIGDEKVCDGWLISQLGFTARHGRNLRAVYRNLSSYKTKCVRLGVTPTNLYKLAHADAECVEVVLKLYEGGKRPLGQEVSAILKAKGGSQEIDLPVEERSGLVGLAKYGAQEQRIRITRFKELLLHILMHIIEAYEPKMRGKAVIKSHLREKIRLQAEEAHELLKVMVGLLRRDDHWEAAIGHIRLQEPETDGGWAKLIKLLGKLHHIEEVASKTLPDFLYDRAIPELKWALDLDDKDVAALLEKAAENNASKGTKKSGKNASTKSRPAKTTASSHERPLSAVLLAENSKHKLRLPDFGKSSDEKAA